MSEPLSAYDIALVLSAMRATQLISVDEIAWLAMYTKPVPTLSAAHVDALWERILADARAQMAQDAASFSAGRVIAIFDVVPRRYQGDAWELVAETCDRALMYRFEHRTLERRLDALDGAGRVFALKAIRDWQTTLSEAEKSKWRHEEYEALLDRARERVANAIDKTGG